MVRLYGKAPYKIVLVHGGPGAIGSLKGLAQEINERLQVGVVEALQSKYSIEELIEELYSQIQDNCNGKLSLLGHSWGAWLAVFFAEKYPELIERLILIGSGPLVDKYVPEISARRFQNLSEEDGVIFQRVIDNQATDADMEKIPKILDKSDNYCLVDRGKHRADKVDSEMYNKVWNEAARLRTNGELLTAFQKIKGKIYLIQGDSDPHPAKGVTMPLLENGIPCEAYILAKCGHNPFMEKYARDEFYDILFRIMT